MSGRGNPGTAIALGVAIMAMPAILAVMASRSAFPNNSPAAGQSDPTPAITATLTVTATATITPTVATPTPTYQWVNLHVDDALRVQICDGLAPVVGTVPPPLVGCSDMAPWREAPPIATPGQLYILWPGSHRYRVYIDTTATPWPGWCNPRVVTATSEPSPTAPLTITPDAIGTAVAATLTALAPTPTGTPRATDTHVPTALPEAAPTAAVWRLTLFPLFNRRGLR